MKKNLLSTISILICVLLLLIYVTGITQSDKQKEQDKKDKGFDEEIINNAKQLFTQGRSVFRFETFGDEIFWSDMLKLHRAIEGSQFGGVGNGLSPKDALAAGLKVDLDALPPALVNRLKRGEVNLNDPAVTLELLKLNAVVGVIAQFNTSNILNVADPPTNSGALKSVGLTCAVCHSTVDNALSPGIGHRLDGWANRDLNVGGIVSLAPDLSPFTNLLMVNEATVKKVLRSWGPGKFEC